MDTVREETSSALSTPAASTANEQFLFPAIRGADDDDALKSSSRSTSISSRRPSLILAALRRPSQALALSAAHAFINQKKQILNFAHNNSDKRESITSDNEKKEKKADHNREIKYDTLTTILSALYGKILVVLGIAFPMTEIISKDVSPYFYQGFYLFLYLGSICFVAYMYTSLVRNKALYSIFGSTDGDKTPQSNGRNRPLYSPGHHHQQEQRLVRYGSFYLRLGAIAFGIGSMVYSGLEFGQYFEMKNDDDCYSSILQAITPATRMILTIIQIQFIFLNSRDIDTTHHNIISKFGLMHMIATNLCEWLYVIVEETEHEILHLAAHNHNISHINCRKANVMTSLVANASPFLFPCTIEYSLICAVILLEMWKKVNTVHTEKKEEKKEVNETRVVFVSQQEKVTRVFNFQPQTSSQESAYHFTVDCSNSHKGLFAGILVTVLTIISLTMFFVLRAEKGTEEEMLMFKAKAQLQVNVFELTIQIISLLAVALAMYKFRNLKYETKTGENSGLGLDNTLLVVAQTGMFIYCVFAIIGSYFTTSYRSPAGLLAEIFSFTQTCLQTIFVLDSWTKRCQDPDQVKHKPGRELITFLIVVNMSMWSINCLEKQG